MLALVWSQGAGVTRCCWRSSCCAECALCVLWSTTRFVQGFLPPKMPFDAFSRMRSGSRLTFGGLGLGVIVRRRVWIRNRRPQLFVWGLAVPVASFP